MIAETQKARKASLPKHAIPLYGDDWAVWRCAGLRATGFPADLVLRLSFPECAAAADLVHQAEQRLDEAREQACEQARQLLDQLPEGDETRPQRRALLDSLQAFKQGKVHKRARAAVGEATVEAVRAAEQELEAVRAAYQQAYDQAVRLQSANICEIVSDPRFREAVLWQNHHAYTTGVLKLLDYAEDDTSSSRRQKEELVVKYLQRYTVKNDTIGFFGPVGWASLEEQGPPVEVHPGPQLLATRNVYLESWGVSVLARTIVEWEGVRHWLKPRYLPLLYIEGNSLHRGLGPPVEVTETEISVLEAADGSLTANQIAQEMVQDPNVAVGSEQEIYELLEKFRTQGMIGWDFVIPVSPFALDALHEQVMAIGDEALRNRCLEAVNTLEAGRRAIADAAGNVEALESAINQLNEDFTRMTGQEATRKAGENYASRTLTYEDCRRDIDLRLGPDVVAEIGKPLSLLLLSVRWLSHAIADQLREVARGVYLQAAQGAGSQVPIAQFWSQLAPILSGENCRTYLDEPIRQFQERWLELIQPALDQHGLQLSSADLRAKAEELFKAPGPGWFQARYHSPDVMVTATSAEALRRGDFQLVLGELHATANTMNVWLFAAQHPNRQELCDAVDNDIRESRMMIYQNHAETTPTRFGPTRIAPHDWIVPPMDHIAALPVEQLMDLDSMVVLERGEELRMESLDGSFSVDIAESVGYVLTYNVLAFYRHLPDAPHWPRITIDRMVIYRESWAFDAQEMTFVQLKTPAERFAGARAWCQQHELPNKLFVRVATELKPFYVDLESPVYVEFLCKAVRASLKAGGDLRVKMSEMLPVHDHVWLPDAEGNRYTSELRLVVTDRVGYED